MEIRPPCKQEEEHLRRLWKIAFGDPDSFLDLFFSTAYSSDRCRCIWEDSKLAAVLYWFDCSLRDQKLAYIYAVATHPDFRGRGLCRMLMADTHTLLKSKGYAAALLVPQSSGLRKMYAGMGYRDAGGLEEFTCTATESAVPVRTVRAEEFTALRRGLLPEGSVLQEGAALAFLEKQMQFFAGEDFLMAAWAQEETLHAAEYLGSPEKLPGILSALGFSRGIIRVPGDSPFAMFHPLEEHALIPQYFGFAFD